MYLIQTPMFLSVSHDTTQSVQMYIQNGNNVHFYVTVVRLCSLTPHLHITVNNRISTTPEGIYWSPPVLISTQSHTFSCKKLSHASRNQL